MNENTKNIAPGPERHRSDNCGAQECMKATPESPKATIVRLETRLQLLHENLTHVVAMSDSRGNQIESLTIHSRELARERQEIAFAVGSALDRLAIGGAFANGDAGAIAMIAKVTLKRQGDAASTVRGLLRLLKNLEATPGQLRAYPEVNPQAMGNLMDAVVIGLTTIERMMDGSGEGVPEFPDTGSGLEQWLANLRAAQLDAKLEQVTGGQTLYWCPACKRHIHPENLESEDCGATYFHPHENADRAQVEIRHQFSGPERKEPPVEWVDWQTKMGRLLVKHGIDADSVRSFNFFQCFGNGQTPEEVIDELIHHYRL